MFMNTRMLPRGQVTARNIGGRSHDDPVGPRLDPQALSRSVISFEPRTWGWLVQAINAHERQDGAQRLGDRQKHYWEVTEDPVGPRPDPWALSRPHKLIRT